VLLVIKTDLDPALAFANGTGRTSPVPAREPEMRVKQATFMYALIGQGYA